jgi:methylenetetrahydrofolate reductase (NADPH)
VCQALKHLGFEVIPFKKTREAVLAHVPRQVPLTITASPAKGQDATIDLAVQLTGDGYSVSPHLSAQQIRDRAHLADIIARCREAGITGAFVIGGDRTGAPAKFRDAHHLLAALHELDHGFTDIGIGGHPEGHPAVSEEALFAALLEKAPLATHITTQIVFDPKIIVGWARELKKQQSLLWRFFVPGGYSPDKIISGLARHLGQPDNHLAGFHVFTFNDLEPVSATALMSATPGPERSADHGRLLIRCSDRPGVVSAISTFLTDAGANIVTLAQHSTAEAGGAFFQRTEFHLPGLPAARDELERAFAADVAGRFDIEFTLTEAAKPKRVAIMVSKTDHCVLDLLWRNRRGELDLQVAMVISNHPDLADEIRPFGAGPYQKAKDRGVKLIGATAHYVTQDLDEGPIIEQDVVRVDHRHTTADLVRLGADVERAVLSRAVRWYCEDRIVRDGNTTVVF